MEKNELGEKRRPYRFIYLYMYGIIRRTRSNVTLQMASSGTILLLLRPNAARVKTTRGRIRHKSKTASYVLFPTIAGTY